MFIKKNTTLSCMAWAKVLLERTVLMKFYLYQISLRYFTLKIIFSLGFYFFDVVQAHTFTKHWT